MLFKRIKYITFLLYSCLLINGQDIVNLSGSTAGLGVGQATVSWNDAHAAANNQAGMLGTDNFAFQASAGRLWGLVNVFSTSASKKFNDSNAIGISIKHVGDSDLNRQIIGLSYARKILKNWDISIQADLLSNQTQSFGNKYLATLELGSMIQATEKLRVGFHVFNPFGLALTETEEIPAIIRLGVLYELSKKVHLMAEVEQQLVLDYDIKAGIDYELIENLHLRSGFSTRGSQLYFGLAYGFGNFAIHGATSIHPNLGITPAGEISFQN